MSRSRAITEMLLLFLAFFLPGYVAQSLGASPGAATNLVMLQSIITGVPQLLLIAYVAGVGGPFTSPQWGCSPLVARDAMRLAILVVACFAVITPFAALTAVLPREWTAALTAGYRWGLRSATQLPLALLFCLTAGYREELFFRAYLIGRLEEMGTPLAIAIGSSTVLFCLGHVYEGPLGIALAAGLGVLFSAVFVRRRNLHLISLAHGLYNFIILSLSLFHPPGIARSIRHAYLLSMMMHDVQTKAFRGTLTGVIAALLLISCAPRETNPSTAATSASTVAANPVLPEDVQKAGLDIPTQELASSNFTLEAMTGGSVSLSSYKGKVVLLSFWATWCVPCQQEMPAMQKLYDQLKSKGLVIVAVDVGEDKATVSSFLKKNHYTFPVLLDTTGDVAGSGVYSANAIPTNFVIDKNGNIRGRKIGIDGPEWTSSVRVTLFERLLSL